MMMAVLMMMMGLLKVGVSRTDFHILMEEAKLTQILKKKYTVKFALLNDMQRKMIETMT